MLRTTIFVIGLCIATISSLRAQLLGGDLIPTSISGDTIEIEGSVYYNCTNQPALTDSLLLNLDLNNSSSLEVMIKSSRSTLDTIYTACNYCGCPDTSCLYPYIYKKTYIYKFITTQFGFQSICKINAVYKPGFRQKKYAFIDSAGNTKLNLSCYINLCAAKTKKEYAFEMNPAFFAINDQYYIHSQGFSQVFNNGVHGIDSIAAKLTRPRRNNGKSIGYNAGYDAFNPLSYNGYPNTTNNFPRGFHLQSESGDLKFSPTLKGNTIIKTAFTAFNDSNKIIVSGQREFMLTVINNASEKPPFLTGKNYTSFLNQNNFKLYQCFGQKKSFFFKANDLSKSGAPSIKPNIQAGLQAYIKSNISRDSLTITSKLDSIYAGSRPLKVIIEIEDTLCSIGSTSSISLLLYNNRTPRAKPFITFEGNRTFKMDANMKDSFNANGYRWRINGDTFYVKDSSFKLKTPGTYKYELLSYGFGGCNDTINGTYVSPSFPYALINSSIREVCQYDSLSLSANYLNTTKTPDLFWNEQNLSATFDFVIERDTQIILKSVFNDGTINYDSISITMLPNPKPHILKTNNHCPGNELKIKADFDSSIVDTKTGINWLFNNAIISTADTCAISTEGDLHFNVTYQNGCSNSAFLDIKHNLEYDIGDYIKTACPQQPLSIQANKVDSFNYKWLVNGVVIHDSSSTLNIPKASKNDTIVLLTSYIAKEVTCLFEDTLKISMLPTLPFNVVGDTVYCANDSAFSLVDSSFVKPNSGIWTDQNTTPAILNDTAFNPSFLSPVKKEHKVTYTTTHPESNCTYNRSVNFEILPLIQPQFVKDSIQLCIGGNDIELNSSSYAIPTNGTWVGKGVYPNLGNGYRFSPSLVGVNSTNTINYKFKGGNGCTSTTPVTVTVNLKPNPIAPVRSGIAPLSIYFEDKRDTTDCLVDEWFWDFYDTFGENCTSDATVDSLTLSEHFCRYSTSPTPVHRYRKSGIYPVKLVVRDSKTGIKDSIIRYNYVFLIASSQEESLSSQVSVFPNPASSYIQISQNYDLPIKSYRLFNAQGKLLAQGPIEETLHSLDISAFKAGVLFLELTDFNGETMFTKTVLVK